MHIRDSFALLSGKLNTRWLRAYLLGYFIAMTIAATLDIRSAILLQSSNMLRASEFAAKFLPALLCLGTGIVAFLFMNKMTLTGYRWNVLHMGCMALYLASENSMQITILGADIFLGYAGCMAILLPLFFSIWFYPNYLYFKKRKELFRAYSQKEIELAQRQHSRSSREKTKTLVKTKCANTRWLYLYVAVFMPVIAVVCSLGLVFNRFVASTLWLAIVQGQALDCLTPLIMLGLRVAAVSAFLCMQDITPEGYRWNLAFLWIDLAAWTLRIMLDYYPAQELNPYRIPLLLTAFFIYFLAWFLPNLIYFKKRKQLFHPNTVTDA